MRTSAAKSIGAGGLSSAIESEYKSATTLLAIDKYPLQKGGDHISKDDTFRVIKRAEEHFYELVPRLLQFTPTWA